MFTNFTEEYKKALIDAENNIKSKGYKEILSEDVFLEIIKTESGSIYDLFSSYGINEKITIEVLTQNNSKVTNKSRVGEYSGISKLLKDIIVSSVKIAASHEKKKAGIEDFMLAMIKGNEPWFISYLDFLGINPKDFEQNLINMNGPKGNGQPFDPIDNILNALEEGLGMGNPIEDMDNNPFFGNKKPTGKKDESLTPALDFFGIDLTQEAKNGKIDTIIGREKEIDRLISVINRKTKNNPCLVGEPGVGKTAVIEGLAKRISEGTVPLAMQNKRIVSLDLGSIIAGTKYRGEFESRIKQIIDEASKLENEVVLFIDEIHTIIGAGSGEGSLDAANILKPAMGRGKISVIGATTLNEYQKHIEKDSALERRFQKIEVEEPTSAVAKEIIEGLKVSFEDFHNLIIEDDAIEAAVDYSVRYITDRYLPDKAIDLIDEACSAKSMKYNYEENGVKEIKLEIEKLQKDIENFVYSQQYHKAIIAKDKQKELESKIKEKKGKKIIPKNKRLHITKDDIQKIVNQITGVPMENLSIEDIEKLKKLELNLKKRIIGQDEAIKSVVSSIKRSRTGITDKNRPIGSFLFLGPTGVGKTELVKALAQEFYGDQKALIKVDMSEYSEKASISKLLGSAPGYVGYEEGGMLTEKVRRKPYSIVLFDELEKGNFEIYNILLQILEEGSLTDGKGRKINFKNTIIIMTSNIGSEEFMSKATQIGFDVSNDKEAKIIKDYEKIKEKVLGSLDEYFAPEFINRIDKTLVFNALNKDILKKIVVLQLNELVNRLKSLNISLAYDNKAVLHILKDTYNPEYGARPVRRYIQDKIEDELSNLLLNKKINGTITISTNKNKLIFI
ncbi:MAG: ATP-dependent Clp protease ATP-binding subunit [Candidatus Gracilibacteria bacterium]|nr:ATP-dependent Clp protease ATP-binding subunit [Candidatus Gracilibacteria bacterium]